MSRFNPRKLGITNWYKIIIFIVCIPIFGFTQNFPLELPELPEGKKIQIFYNSVVNDPLDPLTTSFIGQQDTVFYGGGFFLLSDDPATMAADDITLTPAAQFACNSFDGVVYVDQSATGGSNDGSSWGDAFLDLQDALLAKSICPENVDTILVAEGTYHPTDDGNRDSSFNIPDSVVVMGGFPSGGSTLAERNELCELYPTVLSGEIQGDNNNTNNSYHVVYTDHVSEATVVDGFVITLGYALTGSINARGGGWFNDGSGAGQSSNPTIRNCTFIINEAHFGGGLYNEGGFGSSIPGGAGGEASPVITNCRFENNFAATYGGAVYNSGYQGISSPVIINSIFIGNTTQDRGGAIMNYCISYNDIDSESSPLFDNCEFSGNSASSGGAVFNWSELGSTSSPAYALVSASFVNCVFSGNSAKFQGGALDSYCDHGTDSSLFVNCVISGNYAGNFGGAMSLFGDLSVPEIINSIFYNNSAGSGNPVFDNANSANPSIQNSLFDVDFATVNHNMVVTDNGGNKFETDPLFAYAPPASAAPTTAGDFRLMSGSPAIDMGDNTANMEAEDLDGLSRVYNGTIDMGAYEWRPYCLPDTVYLDENGEGMVDESGLVGELPEFPGCAIDTVLEVPSVSCSDTAVLYNLFLIMDEMDTVLRCTDTIWVLDTISPVIAIAEVELMLDNECMATMPDLSSYASDNCGVESFIQDPSAGDNLGLPGEIVTVTLTAIDSSGNESIETFDIEVQETAPVVPLNCRIRISPAVHPDGTITVRVDDLITNASCLANHDVTVYNQWGGVIWEETGMRSSDYVLEGVNLCDYLGEGLEVSVGNELGSCTNTLLLDENGSVEMISAFGTTIDEASDLGIPTARIDTGLLVTYCGYVPAPEDHEPSVIIPCSVVNTRGSSTPYSVKAQPDWIEVVHCNEESDTSEVIYRKWEVFNKAGDLFTLTDTIVVLRLPMLTAESFVGYMEDTTFCEIEPLEEEGESVKRYAAWKQPLGIHDYEEAYSKLGGIVYELPATIVAAGLINAFFQGEDVWEEYLECVILKKADGEEITIGDIVGDVGGSPFDTDYWEYLEETTNATQLNYGFLHAIYKLGDLSVSDIVGVTPPLEYFPYLLLEKGDWVLSENGFYEQVTEDWFYHSSEGSPGDNGNANSPYWFAGAWPSIYGSGDCIRYCDVATGEFGSCAVRMLVPELGEGDGEEGCVEICLDELDGNPHCGISIETESQEWAQSGTAGACPATKGQDITVTQTCWANGPGQGAGGVTANECVWEDFDETTTVVDLEESDFESDKKKVAVLSQWLTLIDTIGPIFDFCYPEGTIFDGPNGGPNVAQNAELLDGCEENECGYFQWYHATEEEYEENDNVWPEGSIQAAIVAGEQYPSAQGWEQCNPTVYTTGSHDCSADVYVPSVTLKDDCSGVHHVKAMVNATGAGGPGQGRAVLLERVSEADGFVTFAHTEDPISIPFQGHGNQIEVRYEAADSCWNLSEWYKYIEIKDATPPTVVVDDQVRVSLTNKVAWVNAETFDEGSWDNCGISLRLARRVDWWSDTACVDLCSNEKTYDNWVDLLVDLGFDEVQVEAILDGDVYCGDYDYDIEKLHEFFLEHEEVEAHYYEKLKWLWEDGQECGPMVVHGWLYDIARYVAENCGGTDEHGNPLDLEDLEGFFDRLVGVAGYGKEIAYLGGGWSKAVPFKCEDACEEPMVELLVMDYWCNWGKAWVLVDVEDKSQAEVSKELEDITISCEAYNLFYKDVVEEAAAYNAGGGSAADTSGAYTALDEAFGRYIKTWVNNQGQPTDIDGNVLPDSVLQFYYNTVVCEEKSITEKVADTLHDGKIDWITKVTKESYLDTIREQGYHGVIAVNCSATCEQDVWIDLDDCGYGTITRRFFIQGGCSDKAPEWEVEQVIHVEPACDVRLSMFDVPEDVGTKTEALCVASEDMVYNLPTSLTGNATLLPHLEGALCNAVAIGHEDKVSRILDASGMYKVERTWEIKDWCDKSSQINYVQEIIVQVDPECTEPDVVSREPDPMDEFEIGNREINDRFKLYQNQPNPFDGFTEIGFELPEDTDARLTIYDVTGKILKEFKGEYKKGYNEVQLAPDELPVTGVLYYQLDTDKYTATKRMVKVE